MNTDSHLGLFFYKNTFCLLEGKHNDLQLTELITAHSHPTSTLHHVIIQRQHGALEIMSSLIQLHKTDTFSVPYKHIQSDPATSFPHAAFCPSQKKELLLFLQWLFDLYSKFKRQKFCFQEWVLQPSHLNAEHTWNPHRLNYLIHHHIWMGKWLQSSSYKAYYTMKIKKILAIIWLLFVFHSAPSDIKPRKKHICEIIGRGN